MTSNRAPAADRAAEPKAAIVARYGRAMQLLLVQTGARSLLDFGARFVSDVDGKALIPPGILVETFEPTDPHAVPVPAEVVACLHVLEYADRMQLESWIGALADVCDPYGLVAVHTFVAADPASRAGGIPLICESADWWTTLLARYLDVKQAIHMRDAVAFLVTARGAQAADPGPLDLAVPPLPDAIAIVPFGSAGSRAWRCVTYKHRGQRLSYVAADEAQLALLQATLDGSNPAVTWLETLPSRSTVLELGAGAGAHSVFAAVVREATVLAYESDMGERAALVANISGNAMGDRIVALDIAPSGTLLVDELIAARKLPAPSYLKVSAVFANEDCLKPALQLLAAPSLRQVLIELAPASADGQRMLAWLEGVGLRSDLTDGGLTTADRKRWVVLRRAIPDGEDVLNRRFSITLPQSARGRAVLRHVLDRVATAKIESDPFPYSVIDGVLPDDYYAEVLANFPAPDSLRPIGDTGRVPKTAYRERNVVLFTDDEFCRMTEAQQRFWRGFASWMYSDLFLNAFVMKFHQMLEPRLSNILAEADGLKARGDAMLVNDQTNYAIGPHTDAPHRLVTFLFYLPGDTSMRELGTSVYRAKDPNFVCWGGPHHPFEKFDLVRTVEFLPNRLLAFPKTERSFHGVGQIRRENVNRPLLINNIRLLNGVTH